MSTNSRRFFVGFVLFAIFCPMPLVAKNFPTAVEYVLQDDLSVVERDKLEGEYSEKIEVRGEGPRSDRWITHITQASVTLYMPQGEPTAAVVVCPGGGYSGLSFDKEGVFVAKWLRERGVAAGVLKYRCHMGKPLGKGPLEDAQFALRFMKQKIGSDNVGIMGFSAGGHLAASASNHTVGPSKSTTGSIASYNSAPAFSVLVYPVISMDDGVTHRGSGINLLGNTPTKAARDEMSIEKQITDQTPPALLIHTADDQAVPAENSVRYFRRCKANGVSAELHIYPTGGHGYGMWQDEGTISTWPAALEAWLVATGVIDE